MARKKKRASADMSASASASLDGSGSGSVHISASASAHANARTSAAASTSASASASLPTTASTTPTPALVICRNKHWRYISSFHGPWLQLPPEVLESLAHSNFLSPRPHPVDPAVFFDLLNIRRAVDDATSLAVRAASNTAGGGRGGSSSHDYTHPYGPVVNTTRLSRERRHRMRELATAKLSHAYRLDEIAASVATMQSASSLDDVAALVLQRCPLHADARYVHFFHEKIPSRTMAQSTPLHALDALVADAPHDPPPLRTRALTRLFKDDYHAAAKDLSQALAAARFQAHHHRPDARQLVLAHHDPRPRDWRHDVRVADDDQPSSLETQLLFHRAGVYLTIACRHVHAALDGPPDDADAARCRADARKLVRQNAKRALCDYIAFLAHFDYTPGISPALADEFLRRLGTPAPANAYAPPAPDRLLDASSSFSSPSSPSSCNAAPVSEALVPHRRANGTDRASWPKLPPPEIFQVSQLFDTVPPSTLPPYPAPPAESAASAAATAFADSHETITYHPLLTDALHSLLLCHALLQTPAKEHARHARNAARCARVCDGYPIFLAARSPARADWIEVLRRVGNWIGLPTSWENLCRPAPLPTSKNGGFPTPSTAPNESLAQKRERQKHEAILEALADERVVDEESFQRAVRARERRNHEDEEADKSSSSASSFSSHHHQNGNSNGCTSGESSKSPCTSTCTSSPSVAAAPSSVPKRWAQDEGREYPISTDRAEAITRWVRDAPPIAEGSGKKRRAKGKGKKIIGVVVGDEEACEGDLAASVETLGLQDEEEDEGEEVE